MYQDRTLTCRDCGAGGTGRENRPGVLDDGYGIETGKKTLRRTVLLARIIKAGKEALSI